MHAVALKQNGMWIDFQFVNSNQPLVTAMRHVYPQFRDEVTPVILGSYTDEGFDALMSTPMYADFLALYDSDAMIQIGTGVGFNDFVNLWFPQSSI